MGTTEVAEDAPPPPPALAELSLAEAGKGRWCGPRASLQCSAAVPKTL